MASSSSSTVDSRFSDPGAFQRVLNEASKDIPRFLFRAWSPESGGDHTLNTTEQITPHAFRDGKGPLSLSEVKLEDIASSVRQHLLGESHASFFSSWSASLPIVSNIAFNATNPHDSYITIVDTSKLGEHNHVHWCGTQDFTSLGGGTYADEYHIFGIVRGPGAYQAMPSDHFFEFINSMTTPLNADESTSYSLDTTGPSDWKLSEAIRIGKLFHQRFGPVVNAPLLAVHFDVSSHVKTLDILRKELSVDDSHLDSLMKGEATVPQAAHPAYQAAAYEDVTLSVGWTATHNANVLLRALLKRRDEMTRLESSLSPKEKAEADESNGSDGPGEPVT